MKDLQTTIYKQPAAHAKSLSIVSHCGTQIPTVRVPLPSVDGEGREDGELPAPGRAWGALNLQPRWWGRLMCGLQNGRQVPGRSRRLTTRPGRATPSMDRGETRPHRPHPSAGSRAIPNSYDVEATARPPPRRDGRTQRALRTKRSLSPPYRPRGACSRQCGVRARERRVGGRSRAPVCEGMHRTGRPTETEAPGGHRGRLGRGKGLLAGTRVSVGVRWG